MKKGRKKQVLGLAIVLLLLLILSIFIYPSKSTPQIISASLYPSKIREGDILSITAEIQDRAGISSVEAIVQHERGTERVELFLTEGTARNGTWKGYWIAHSTKNQKWYPLNLTITNTFGKIELATLQFQDPVQNHSASEVTAGTFDTGDYVFPGNLNVTDNLNVSGNLTIDEGLTISGQSSAKAYRGSTTQTTTGAQWTIIEFDTEAWDIQNEFDSTTNYRFTAKQAGKYQVNARVYWSDPVNEAGYHLAITKSGTNVARTIVTASGTSAFDQEVSDVVNLAANDYIDIRVYSAADETISFTEEQTSVSIIKVA